MYLYVEKSSSDDFSSLYTFMKSLQEIWKYIVDENYMYWDMLAVKGRKLDIYTAL